VAQDPGFGSTGPWGHSWWGAGTRGPGETGSFVPEDGFLAFEPFGEALAIGILDNATLDLQGRSEETVVHRPDVLDQHQALQALMLVEIAVDLFQQAPQADFQFEAGAVRRLVPPYF